MNNYAPFEFKPSLAIDINKVKSLPKELMCSKKYDGIRCTFFSGTAYSRSLKLIPNKSIQAFTAEHMDILERIDCELIVGDPFAKDVFSRSTSGCMRIEGQPEFTVYAFDLYLPGVPFKARYELLKDLVESAGIPNLVLVQHWPVEASEIKQQETRAVFEGAEGLMVRDANGMYKCGRSGTKSPELMKVKSFTDEEFVITGYEPKYHNSNEAQVNELGRTKRSSHQAGMVPLDTLGALVLRTKDNKTFNVGTGFDDKLRDELWSIRDTLLGKLCKIKHFPIGAVDVPRLPVFLDISSDPNVEFLGIRSELDIS